jgi:hypothetical protein
VIGGARVRGGRSLGARPATVAPLARASQASVGRVPDFFVVGQPKAGTTALYEMLRAHPQIYMPDGKEPWYFAEELLERTPPRPGGTPRTLQEYTALFADARSEQRAGEASALYLWSRTAARRIAQAQPQARIVAILREPASLLRSLHLQYLTTHVESETDFATAIGLEQNRREGRDLPRHTYWPQALRYSDHVRYVEQLRRYEAVLPREQILVLIYDDFRADNDGSLRAVLRFLDVDDTVDIELREANRTMDVRSQRLNEMVRAVSVGRGPISRSLKRSIKALTPRELRRGALRAAKQRVVEVEPAPVDDAFMAELRTRYRGEVEALSDHLDRDMLTLWGYDGSR